METLIFKPDSQEQVKALKAFAKALKISFKTEEKPYDPEFVAKIKESRKQFENGQHKEIAIDDLWK